MADRLYITRIHAEVAGERDKAVEECGRERALRLQSEGKPPARGGFGKRPVCVVFFVGGAFLLFSHHRLPV